MRSGLCVVAAALAIVLAGGVARADSGIGVYNAPPTFLNITVGESGGYVAVNINISDQNGWRDVFYVNVVVLDGSGVAIENATYSQHDTNTSYDVVNDKFKDNAGGNLIPARCSAYRFFNTSWFLENNTLRLTFLFEQFQGKTLRVSGVDVKHTTCIYDGPFSSAYRPEPLIKKEIEVIALVSVSVIIAMAVGLAMSYRRVLSNRLARKIETIERGHAEQEED